MEETDFVFEIPQRHKYSKEEIIQNLVNFSLAKKGLKTTAKEYDLWDKRLVSSETVRRIFGSWLDALEKSGISKNACCVNQLNPKELIEIFKHCCQDIGNLPSKQQLRLYLNNIQSPYSVASYVYHFGGLRRILRRMIDFEKGKITEKQLYSKYNPKDPDPLLNATDYFQVAEISSFDVKRRKYSKEEIVEILKKFFSLNNFQPFSARDYRKWKDAPVSSATITDVFGSWANALQNAGIKPKREFKRDPVVMIEYFMNCWKALKKPPSRRELDEFLKKTFSPYTSASYYAFFGGLGRLAHRIVDYKNRKISDQELYAKHKYHNSRRPIPVSLRFKVLERDKYRCVRCGATANDRKLEVDHKIPVSQGGNDSLDNLQTLCWDCNRGKRNKYNH